MAFSNLTQKNRSVKKMSTPAVSVLIPVYNREDMIVDAVKSSLGQTFRDIEVVVVDNCSTDRTYDIVKSMEKEDPRLRVYKNEENIGPVLNWKRCLDHASANFVKILYSDDWMDKRFIEKTYAVLSEAPEAAFVYTATLVHHPNGRSLLYSQNSTGIYDLGRFIRGQIFGEDYPVSPGCALFRKKDVQKNLLIDISNNLGLDFKSYGAGNDLLIYLLCSRDYDKFYFIADPLAHFRDHHGSFTMTRDLSRYYLVSKKHYFDHYGNPSDRDLFYFSLHRANRKREGKYDKILNGSKVKKDLSLSVRFWFLRKMAQIKKKIRNKGDLSP